MTPTERGTALHEALAFAFKAHQGQPYGRWTYFANHVVPVAIRVAQADCTEYQIHAALLHDVVEDTDATIEDVEAAFGTHVAAIVTVLTDGPGNRKTRKAALIERLKGDTNAARSALSVKLADLIVNGATSCSNNAGLFRMYQREYPTFREALFDGSGPETWPLWRELDWIMDQDPEAPKETP